MREDNPTNFAASQLIKLEKRCPPTQNVIKTPPMRVTPAMEAGITDHIWSLEEIVGLLLFKFTVDITI